MFKSKSPRHQSQNTAPRFFTTLALSQGFTLIELMIAIAVLSLLLGIGVPGFTHLIAKYKGKSAALSIYTTYQFARSEAIKRGREVQICGSNDGKTCLKDWQGSLLVFADANENNIAESDELIRSTEFNHRTGHIESGFSFGNLTTTLLPNGGAETGGNFFYCNPQMPQYSREIKFYRWGRAYFSPLHFKNNTLKNKDGKKLACG